MTEFEFIDKSKPKSKHHSRPRRGKFDLEGHEIFVRGVFRVRGRKSQRI